MMKPDDDAREEDLTDLPAVSSPDGFAMLAALLALMTDPKAFAARLRQLRETSAAAERAQADLGAARQAHDALVAKEKAELGRLKQQLADREGKLAEREVMLEHRTKVQDDRKAALDRREGRRESLALGGLTREFAAEDDLPRLPPAHVEQAPSRENFLAGSTLTRSVEASRRG